MLLCWFRFNLRLHDNPPWQAALEAAKQWNTPVLPVFILDEASHGDWPLGGASKWWLHHALVDLDQQLQALGSRLIVRQGSSAVELLNGLLKETGATAVYCDARVEPSQKAVERTLAQQLAQAWVAFHCLEANTLVAEGQVKNQQEQPYQVFSQFWKQSLKVLEPPKPLPFIQSWPQPETWPNSTPVEALALLPKIQWDAGFYEAWDPTRKGAEARLAYSQAEVFEQYQDGRDLPGRDGTSKLSPYLHWGQMSPREIWHGVLEPAGLPPVIENPKKLPKGIQHYISELGWREFAYQLLHAFPETPSKPLKPQYESFPWRSLDSEGAETQLKAWQDGQTGYPMVDAGMRQLYATGWMHNRTRMIAGSLLVKHLLLPWQAGAAWFWDTLVDADLASNTLGWQWVAGCGADASPYFRVFNPIIQGKKFDTNGQYVRRWVPELDKLTNELLHEPWNASGTLFQTNYPPPIIAHEAGRAQALKAFETFKDQS